MANAPVTTTVTELPESRVRVEADTCSAEAEDCSATAATSPMPPSARWGSAEICWTAPAISATHSVIDSTARPQVAAGEEVLADGHELLEPGDVAVGELLGMAVDLAQAAEADEAAGDEGEDEESERGAQPRGQTQVQEGLHGPGHRPLDARLKRSRARDHCQRASSSPQSARPATRWPTGPV